MATRTPFRPPAFALRHTVPPLIRRLRPGRSPHRPAPARPAGDCFARTPEQREPVPGRLTPIPTAINRKNYALGLAQAVIPR
ncbi:hypothetical protein Amsp01_025160 [Amycolatopsis sp. NBRC 101858]|nr:hypothetical protein Amsp01_025160 [Amycolatopsis sp. NBRC 101858]